MIPFILTFITGILKMIVLLGIVLGTLFIALWVISGMVK